MVIYLLKELITKCQLNTQAPQRVEFFENLAYSRMDGKHFLIGDREVFEQLMNLSGMSKSAKSIYKKIYKKFSTESAIISQATYRFNIGISDLIEPTIITFNIDYLKDSSFSHYNNLLLENTIDTFAYHKAVEFYQLKKNLKSINYYWDLRNGGGTTSCSEFLRLNDLRDVYTFAILDSDKICPSDSLGGTALQFTHTIEHFGMYQILEVHEVENLIPNFVYSQYITSKNDSKLTSNLDIFNSDSELLNYLDIKKGIKKFVITNGSQETKDYYSHNLNIPIADLYCNCASKNDCNCFIFNPMGRDIFNIINNFIKQNSLNILDFINESLSIIYLNLGEKLFWIFCKSNQIRII